MISPSTPKCARPLVYTNPLPVCAEQECGGRTTLQASIGRTREDSGLGAHGRGIVAQTIGGVVGETGENYIVDIFSLEKGCRGGRGGLSFGGRSRRMSRYPRELFSCNRCSVFWKPFKDLIASLLVRQRMHSSGCSRDTCDCVEMRTANMQAGDAKYMPRASLHEAK